MKIAVAQIDCSLGENAANVAKLRAQSVRARAAGAEMIVFPEMSDTGYAMTTIRKHATGWDDGAVPELRACARELGLTIVCGVSERVGASIYNSQILIDAAGAIAGRYRKTHLFSPAPIAEHECITAGDEIVAYRAGTLRLGLSICYDLRFPEVYRRLARQQRANAFVVSSAWPFPRFAHLRVLATARAIENQSYVVVANRVGTDAGVTFCGSSAIIDPAGTVLAAASADHEELLLAEVSAESVEEVRGRMAVLEHCRDELYGGDVVG